MPVLSFRNRASEKTLYENVAIKGLNRYRMVTSVSCGLFYLMIYRVISLDPTQMKSTWFISFQGMTKSLEPLQRSFKNNLSGKYSYNLLFERTKYQKRGRYRDVQRYLVQRYSKQFNSSTLKSQIGDLILLQDLNLINRPSQRKIVIIKFY